MLAAQSGLNLLCSVAIPLDVNYNYSNLFLAVFTIIGSDYSDLTQKLCAMLESACIPAESFFKFPPDVCTLVKNCPFVAGSQYTEMDTIYVSSSFPDVSYRLS